MNQKLLTLRILAPLLALVLATAGCGYQGATTGLTGAERFRCQKADPVAHEACLERARQGHLYHHRY